MKTISIILSVFALLTGCAPTDEISSFNEVNPHDCNRAIAFANGKHARWVLTPYAILHHLLRADSVEEPLPFKFEQVTNPDNSITATVIQEGLQDDSVYGEKWVVVFVSTRTGWVIKSIKKGFRCRVGRGYSESYSGNWCN